MNQELIERATDYALNMFKINGGLLTDYYIHFKAGADWQSSQQINNKGWISIDERLPENLEWCNDRVLFLCNGNVIQIGNYDFEFRQWSNDGGGVYNNVTHWMYLPPPPNN